MDVLFLPMNFDLRKFYFDAEIVMFLSSSEESSIADVDEDRSLELKRFSSFDVPKKWEIERHRDLC